MAPKEPKTTGFRASIKKIFKRDEEEQSAAHDSQPAPSKPEEIPYLAEPEGPPPPKVVKTTVDPKLENESVLAEQRSLATSQKTADGKWKVDMRYVGNYTEDLSIQRQLKQGEGEKKNYADPQRLRLSANELRAGANPDVDPSMKEQYLSEQEFQQIFGMAKSAFNQMPNWKRSNLKKEKNMY